MAVNVEETKEEILEIIHANIHRQGIEDLENWLKKNDFFTAPASSRFHGNFEGGLALHSLNVYKRLKELTKCYAADMEKPYSEEAIAIVALFHDLCKVKYYGTEERNRKNEQGQWEKYTAYKVDEAFHYGGHGAKSVYMIQYCMRLEPCEAAAINCHMGAWDVQQASVVSDVYGDNMLAWMLHVADEAATFVDKV